MIAPLFLMIAVAGGLGAVARLLLDGMIRSRITGPMPWETMTINLSGSLLLGLITGLTTNQLLPDAVHLILGTGFLGGYTTFSTASFETVRLLQERERLAAALNGLGMLLLAAGLAGLGLWLGMLP